MLSLNVLKCPQSIPYKEIPAHTVARELGVERGSLTISTEATWEALSGPVGVGGWWPSSGVPGGSCRATSLGTWVAISQGDCPGALKCSQNDSTVPRCLWAGPPRISSGCCSGGLGLAHVPTCPVRAPRFRWAEGLCPVPPRGWVAELGLDSRERSGKASACSVPPCLPLD